MKAILSPPRLDVFVVWPHGLDFLNAITGKILNAKLDIVRIERVHATQVPSLIDFIYKSDQVPFYHIRSKKKYIKKNIGDAICIFVRNLHPDLVATGSGAFRHSECLTIKNIKNSIRTLFNPKINGVVSENHVIHATDSQHDSIHLAKFFNLNYENMLRVDPLGIPFYLDCHSFTIEKINLNDLICGVAIGDRWIFNVKKRPIRESPHYRFLHGDDEYSSYIDRYTGTALKDYYSVEKFKNLNEKFEPKDLNDFIVVKKMVNYFYVLDGLHRASIFLNRNLENQYCLCLS